MSKTCIYCHIVFGTKHREPTITMEHRNLLYSYARSIIENKKCGVVKIGGIADHIHLLINLHPEIALAPLVKTIKQSTGNWMRENEKFPFFGKWQEGYFAGSIGPEGIEKCKSYIENQPSHHNVRGYLEEMESMVNTYKMEWYQDEW